MRNPHRIPIIIEALKKEGNILKVLDYWFEGEELLEPKTKTAKNAFKNLDIIEEKWSKNTDLRLTQVFITSGIIPNYAGFWYYKEDEDTMVESGLLEYRDILLWTSHLDKDGNRLKQPITRPIKQLDSNHIKNILHDYGDSLSDEYRLTMEKELGDRGEVVRRKNGIRVEFPGRNIIDEWLEEHGDPKTIKLVEKQAEEIMKESIHKMDSKGISEVLKSQKNSKDKPAITKEDSRRYYLHRKCRELGFTLDSYKRTFFHPITEKVKGNKYLSELVEKFGYSLQYEIT